MGLNSMLCMNGGAQQKTCCTFGRRFAKHMGKLMDLVLLGALVPFVSHFFFVKHLPTVDMFVEAN